MNSRASGTPTHAGDAGCEAAPGRGGARFLWVWMGVVLLGAVAALPLLNGVLLNWRSNPNVRWVDELWQRKTAMAAAAVGQPRILIVGGSSALFSIDAEVLQARLGRPVINLGMMAGLGLRHTLDDAREVMKRGDTVLLHIEYEAYQWNDELTDFQRQVLLTNHPARLLHLPWRKAAELTYGAPWSDYLEGWQRRNEEMRRVRPSAPLKDARYTSVELSPCGDCRGEGGPEAPNFRRYPLGPIQRGPGAEAAERLREFLQECRGAGVSVIAMRPVGYPAGNPSPEVIDAAYRGFGRFYQEQNDTPVIENRELFVAPRALMLDTAYHANAAGRRVITETVLKELRRILRLPAPAGGHPVLLVSPLEKNGAGREVVKPAQEFSSCLLLAEDDLHYAGAITPAGVRELLAKGVRVVVNDRKTAAILRKSGLALSPLEAKRSTLAAWMRDYPNHLFALAQVGSFETALFDNDRLPGPVRAFLKDRSPCKAAIFGTGRWSHLTARRMRPDEASLERSRYSDFARAFRQPVDIALLSTLQPIAPSQEKGSRAAAERCAIRIDHYAIEEGAAPGLAVAMIDPRFGIVVKHATWAAPELLEWEQAEVRLSAEGAPR